MVSVVLPSARMFAARNAGHAHPLRTEGEGAEVFDHLRRLGGEEARGEVASRLRGTPCARGGRSIHQLLIFRVAAQVGRDELADRHDLQAAVLRKLI